ncbi:MAG: acetate--CoA ligase family protein [Actinobacteria bacterium]|nr:acetate--CoA ligase family protein [Actinomycetota bacterium]
MPLLDALFAPRRVALVGASDRAGTLGALLGRNLASFPGEVVAVRSGQSLRDVEGPVDLAVVAVPAAAVPAVAADAAAAGVAAMVVLSGGIAETGPDGAALQAALVAAAAGGTAGGHRVRVVGPNCFGVQNCDLPLNASIASGLPAGGGGISFVSQSGAYGMAIYDLAHDDHVRFAKICAPGNTSDVSVTELLDALADDPATRTLCFLLESLPDGRAFVERARAVTADKPVVVLKTGRSAAGARAAASHTAALASREAVWRGAFRQAGVVEVTSGQELLDVARALDGQPLPRGDRVAVVTNSGGTGVELADLLADEGLVVPELSPALQEQVRALLPPYASPANPVDVTPAGSLFATVYPALVDLLARSGEVDAVVPVLLQRSATDPDCVEGVRTAVERLRADGVDVPVYVCWVAPRSARPHADLLQAAGVPVLDWPARTARAIGRAREAARARDRVAARPPVAAVAVTDPEVPDATYPVAVADLLRGSGIDVVPAALCTTADAASDAAAAAGRFPAVVKVARSAHRSDTGGVRLGLPDATAVRAAAADLLTGSDAVLVSPQLSGVEVAVGALRDPSFGPVVMVGLGGIWVEVLDDVAFALAPLSHAQARDLLLGLRGAALLTGGRGTAPVDLDALAAVVGRAGAILTSRPGVAGLDLNPVLASPAGAVAVDWKITV